jgi:hypothetical protein
MASKIEICNLALVKLGANPIVSLEDGTKSATTLGKVYDALLDAEIASHPWTFAKARAQLPASTTAPAFTWRYKYPKPAGFLKMIEVGQDWVYYATNCGALFELEGGDILTDQGSPLKIRYVQRVTNAGLYPALFVTSFACRLAAEVCETLTQSVSKRQAAWDERKEAIREARRSNDIELPPQAGPAQSWERSLYQAEG